MDQLICASLSHSHYWYDVGVLKVPAIILSEVTSRDEFFQLAARLFFFFFPCPADHERDWPPCKKVVCSGWQPIIR